MDNGSVKILCIEIALREIKSGDLKMIDSQGLSGIVLSFAKREFKADKLLNQTEEEILADGTTDFLSAARLGIGHS